MIYSKGKEESSKSLETGSCVKDKLIWGKSKFIVK